MNLSQKQWHKVLSIIQHLHDSLDDIEIREKAGEGLLELLSADHFASYVWDDKTQVFAKPVYLNMSQDNLALYEKYYQFHDPITLKMRDFQRAVSANEVMEQRDLVKTEFFNDFLSTDGLYYGINIFVHDKGNENIGDFRVWRSRARDNFGQQELEILDMIAPHFCNAMRNISIAKHLPPVLDVDEIKKNLSDNYSLTRRELDVAIAILEGNPDKVVSEKLHISMATLRTHLQHIYQKLMVSSRTEFCNKVIFHSAE